MEVGDTRSLDSTKRGASSMARRALSNWEEELEETETETKMRKVEERREKTSGRNHFLFCGLVISIC